MSPKLIAFIVACVLLVGLGYTSYNMYGKLQLAKAETKAVKAELTQLRETKVKSDLAMLELTQQLNQNQEVVTKTITKLVKVPVTVQEKCVSDVLKESLKEALQDD